MPEKFEDREGNLVKCVSCDEDLVKTSVERRGTELHGLKCQKCGEVYFPSSEIARYEALTGRGTTRKFREIGNSLVITIPTQIVKQLGIHDNDIGTFETEDNLIKVKPIHAHK